jgi:hypothetical protein
MMGRKSRQMHDIGIWNVQVRKKKDNIGASDPYEPGRMNMHTHAKSTEFLSHQITMA